MSVIHNNVVKPSSQTSALAFRSEQRPLESFEDMKSVESWISEFPELKGMSRRERAEFVQEHRRDWLREIDSLSRKRAKDMDRLQRLKAKAADIQVMLDFCKDGIAIERPDGPSFRRLRKAVAEGRAVDLSKDIDSQVPAQDFEKEIFRFAEILVVEHDWSAALASADLAEASVRLPFDVCAFEFKFSGQAVIALAAQFETEVYICVVIEHGDKWIVPDFALSLKACEKQGDDNLTNLFNIVAAQIRAICIALDAEVARSDAVREPYVGKDRQNSYQAPRPYHIVSLARRVARPLQSSGSGSGRRVRMHFRRGHWRHFEEHKTWIRWMLVGDPELGFIEKHYRL